MKKIQKIMLAAITISAMLISFGCTKTEVQKNQPPQTTQEQPTQEPEVSQQPQETSVPIEPTTQSISENEKDKYSINIQYPVFGIQDFDKAIETVTIEWVEETKSQDSMANLTGDFDWKSDVEGFVSVKLSATLDTGGANVGEKLSTINFDQKNQKVLKLEDLFKPQSDYLQILSEKSRETFLKQSPTMDKDMMNDGTNPVIENFKNFMLTKDGIEFVFAKYQVASGAEGEQQIVIPYSELTAILKIEIPQA